MLVMIWGLVIGMIYWQIGRVKSVRDEMAMDQLDVIAARIVELYSKDDTESVNKFTNFANKFYTLSENYDPLYVCVVNTATGNVAKRFGSTILSSYEMPRQKSGCVTIGEKELSSEFDRSTKFLFTTQIVPYKNLKVYVFLPYTRRLQEKIDWRVTYLYLVFGAIGIAASLLAYLTTSYIGKNLKLLRNFAREASQNPDFVNTKGMNYPHNELGDICREIANIYNQRMKEAERSEREHEIALHAIEEKERIKRELTGNINHELKTPVGVIQGYIDTIMDDPDMDPVTMRRFLEKTQHSVHRLTALITDITAITKLESDGKLINKEKVSLRGMMERFSMFLDEGKVLCDKMTFSYEVPDDAYVYINESLMSTTLLNFVKNAVAYSEGTICRMITTDEDDSFYYFSFYDNGVGVPPQHLSHLFERFYRVNAGRSRTVGGTGLGLAISEVTIKSFGGDIAAQAHFPTGLEFKFSLPKYKESYDSDATSGK